MFRARSNSRGRTRKKDTEEGEEGTGQEESEQRKSPGIFGSLRRGKSRSRAAQPREAVEVTGTNLEKDKKEEHPDGQEQDEQTGKESPLRESQVGEVVAKGRKSPGGRLGLPFVWQEPRSCPSPPEPSSPCHSDGNYLHLPSLGHNSEVCSKTKCTTASCSQASRPATPASPSHCSRLGDLAVPGSQPAYDVQPSPRYTQPNAS